MSNPQWDDFVWIEHVKRLIESKQDEIGSLKAALSSAESQLEELKAELRLCTERKAG